MCDILGNHEVAQVLVIKMRDIGMWPELATHNFLISTFIKCGFFERAWLEYSAVKALYRGIHTGIFSSFYHHNDFSTNNLLTQTDMLHNYFLLVTQSKNPAWTLRLLKEVSIAIPGTLSPFILALEVFFETK